MILRIFLPGAMALIGITLIILGISEMRIANSSRSWPATEGTILDSSVQQHVRNRQSPASSRISSNNTTTFSARITYEYSIQEKTFNGSRVAIGDYRSGNRGHAEGVVRKYPPGKSVSVYFNPSSPELAVLEPGVQLQAFFLPGLGAFFLILGIFIISSRPAQS